MSNWFSLFKNNWSEVLEEKYFAVKYIFNLVVCYWLYIHFTKLLVANRFVKGVVLNDKIQQWFNPTDFSLPIFIITYGCIIAFVVYILPRPRHFYFACRAFLVVFLFRFAFIHLIPLSPPKDMILLNDPVLNWIVNNNEITNDLFFSGHVADICIFFFCCRNYWLRVLFFLCTAAIAVMLVAQHVHYTGDVLASPFFAYVSYKLFAQKGIDKHR